MSLSDELRIASDGALYRRVEDRAVLRVTGDDRVTWLNGMLTCDVTKVVEGGLRYGLAVTQKGRIQADVQVVPTADAVLLVVPASEMEGLVAAFEKYVIMEDCELAIDRDLAVWSVVGKASAPALARAKEAGAVIGAGSFGGVVLAPAKDAAAVEAALAAGGGVRGADDTFEVSRHEGGIPRFGIDFDGSLYPQEAALEKRAVAFDKGCYLGQEVVCMLELRGHVKRKLVSLAIDAGAPLTKGDEVKTSNGEKVGEVTSSAKSPDLGVLALAMVKASHMTPGTELVAGGAKAVVRDV